MTMPDSTGRMMKTTLSDLNTAHLPNKYEYLYILIT